MDKIAFLMTQDEYFCNISEKHLSLESIVEKSRKGVKKLKTKESSLLLYFQGLKKGLPIGLGYFYVSIAFGMMAVSGGLSPFSALVISMTNLTSAGQFAGTNLIIQHSGYFEIGLTVFVINIRYFLMSLSLTQRLEKMTFLKKACIACGITDEIFTIASLEKEALTFKWMVGLMTLPYIGWALGTYVGAKTTSLLPVNLQDALGIALYAMFIALILPAVKKSKPIFITVALAVSCSLIFKYVPYINRISSGFAVIGATIFAAGIGAYCFPVKEAC